jgi:hypothetical protein
MSVGIRVALGLLASLAVCSASSVTYTMNHGLNSASATFQLLQNGMLQVTLANTSIARASSSSELLTAVFFGFNQNRVLDPLNAGIVSAGNLLNCSGCNTTNVGGEWAYRNNATIAGLPANANLISTIDFGTLTSSERFGSTNLWGSTGVSGAAFGIASSATTAANLGSQLASTPVTIGRTVFTFDPGANFSVGSLSFVGFVYGNNTSSYTGTMNYYGGYDTPEPGTFLLLGVGLGIIGCLRRRAGAAATSAGSSEEQLQS